MSNLFSSIDCHLHFLRQNAEHNLFVQHLDLVNWIHPKIAWHHQLRLNNHSNELQHAMIATIFHLSLAFLQDSCDFANSIFDDSCKEMKCISLTLKYCHLDWIELNLKQKIEFVFCDYFNSVLKNSCFFKEKSFLFLKERSFPFFKRKVVSFFKENRIFSFEKKNDISIE